MGVESTATSEIEKKATTENPESAQEKTSVALVKTQPQKSWKIEDSEDLYRIEGWGEPYFSINAVGNITVSPKGDRGGSTNPRTAPRYQCYISAHMSAHWFYS